MHNLTHLPPVIFLVGPTASGKSCVASAITEDFPVEIISVDSAQVYRYMDIGTAKPDQTTLSCTPHHLINLINPDQYYSAAQFRNDALNIMQEITQRGKIPLLVGGTMLYFKALKEGLSPLPPANQNIRVIIESMAGEIGWPAMHHRLAGLDQETAMRIRPTDTQRIQRALEVCYLTQRPMSEILKTPRQINFPYRRISVALIPSIRSQLHLRIAERFRTMLYCGLIDEVQSIRQRFPFLNIEFPSMRSVGYRQTCLYLDKKIDFAELCNMGTAATRQLAKRQLTWLRSMKNDGMQEFDCLENNLISQVKQFLKENI